MFDGLYWKNLACGTRRTVVQSSCWTLPQSPIRSNLEHYHESDKPRMRLLIALLLLTSVADGFLYARRKNSVVCFDLRAKK